MDYNRISLGLYEKDSLYDASVNENDGAKFVGGKEKRLQEMMKLVKIPGLNRHKMPIIPKIKEEQRIIRRSEILPLLDTSYEQ